jgi:predicted phosphodiesterase
MTGPSATTRSAYPAAPIRGEVPPLTPVAHRTAPTIHRSRSLVDAVRSATGGAGRRVLDRLPPPDRPWVFAVEDTSVQITWRALGPGPLRFRCADTVVETDATGGPGAVVLDGLPSGARLTVTIEGEGARWPGLRGPNAKTGARGAEGLPASWRRLPVRTLAPPPGEELFRFATVSDLHIGADAFGFRNTMREEPEPAEPHPVRCTRAAMTELTAWGAQLMLIKGDLTHKGREREWREIGSLLAKATIPVEMMPGNHDHYGKALDPDPYEALDHLGHAMTRHVASRDVPGLRIVMVDSTDAPRGGGHVRHHQAAVVAELRASDRPALITMHHHTQRMPLATFWPPGIPSQEAARFLGAVAAVQPATFVSSGHTHRHRRRYVGPLVLTEVGSPKDFPGVWAGYVVHEGGIRQVVRRITQPDLLAWTDFTAGAVLGAWGLWSPGLLGHRCFSHTWPPRS